MSTRDQDQRNPQNSQNEKGQPGHGKAQQQAQTPGQKGAPQQQGGQRNDKQQDPRRDQR